MQAEKNVSLLPKRDLTAYDIVALLSFRRSRPTPQCSSACSQALGIAWDIEADSV